MLDVVKESGSLLQAPGKEKVQGPKLTVGLQTGFLTAKLQKRVAGCVVSSVHLVVSGDVTGTVLGT